MKTPKPSPECPDCTPLTRRGFIHSGLTALAATAALPRLSPSLVSSLVPSVMAAPEKAPTETLVTTLYKSLSETQRQAIVFPFDHPLRQKVDNNWSITDKRLDQFYTPDQQAMVKEIFMGLHHPDYAERVYQQVVHDSGAEGFGRSSIALFGEPGTGKFEFVLTGRHVTRRCDGDSVEGTAFGGPLFYGHAAKGFYEQATHPGNAYWYQALRANEVYQMLDGKQREQALLGDGREEKGTATVQLTGKTRDLPGIRAGDLTCDQRDHLRKVIADVLAPFRASDTQEAMQYIEASGIENLHMAFYKNQDVEDDGVWDVWQIEGPSMLMYFRGDPHVHAWIHVKKEA